MNPLYANVDSAQLKSDVDKYLLRSGAPFYADIITGARGQTIVTSDGHEMLDWTSGQMSCLIGHGNPEVVETLRAHAENLDHLFSTMTSPPVISLARRLANATPPGLDKALFLSTGAESNEAAIRLAKTYTGKFEIVGLRGSWHGMTSSSLSAQYNLGRKACGPLMAGQHALPCPNSYRSVFRHPDGSYDWKAELDYGWEMIDAASCGSLAAVIFEPILAAGGILELPPGYLKHLRQHCDRRSMLMIADEALTGLGRTSDLFAFSHHPEDEGFVPDILTLSKTLGNGVPLSAVITSSKIADGASQKGFLFQTTHLNDPAAAAVGDKVLEIVQRDSLVQRSRELGKRFHGRLRGLQSQYGCIGDVRGRGLMAGVEIVSDRETKESDPALGVQIGARMAELGLWARLQASEGMAGVFRICPPLTTTDEEMEAGLAIIEEAFKTTPGTMPLHQTKLTNGH